MFDRYNHKRLHNTPEIVIDICAGDHSLAKYYLRKYPNCTVISYDIRDRDDALKTVPNHLHPRIHFISTDVSSITEIDIARDVRQACPGKCMLNVWHVHASPDCTTMSTAERRTTFGQHNNETKSNAYRLPDGSPNPNAPAYRRNKVEKHDKTLNQILMCMTVLGNKYPDMLLTIENPIGAFELQPQVKRMMEVHEGWRMLTVNYCAAADPRYDGGQIWSMKPTRILLKGARSDLSLPQCNYDCNYRIPNSKRHLVCIRKDHNSDPLQIRATGHMRHAIPGGVFSSLDTSHQEEVNDNSNAPAGMHAVLDESHAQHLATAWIKSQKLHTVACHSCKCHINNITANETKAAQSRWRLIHARYGHQSAKRIGTKKLKGLSKVQCPTCLSAKITKKSHTGSLPKAQYALELVHTDLAEFRVLDTDGNKYAAIFVDDKTDRKWVYMLKQKSDYSEAFKLWLSEIGVPPTRIRSDWGGEYRAEIENSFLKICLERGIWPEKSAPYNPQQNSKAERAVRSLTETARSMLLHAKLGKEYWGYAMRYACYIDMHCISDRTGITPHEAWFGKESIFDPLVFGSQVYFAHAERNTDKKLDPRGHRAVFLGYPSASPGYYVKDLDSPDKSVKITNDVPVSSFDETTGMADASYVITQDEFDLTVPNVKAEVLPNVIPLIGDDRTGIPQERIEYWHALQKFMGERRRLGNGDESEEDARQSILKDWTERQMTVAKEVKQRIDTDIKTDSIRKRLRNNEGKALAITAPPSTNKTAVKPKESTIDPNLACEKCKSPDDEANMLICDGCEKGYHKKCISMTRLPAKAHGWLCHSCIQPGMRVSKLWSTDKQWHDGTVTMQYATEELGRGGRLFSFDFQLFPLD